MHNELSKIVWILLNEKCSQMLWLIVENPGISMVKIQMKLRINHHAKVSEYIKKMKDCNLVKVVPDGKYKRIYYDYDSKKPTQIIDNLAKMLVDAND